MSQPFDRSCTLEPAGALDTAAGQFWVGNPWEIVLHDHNLSAFERNVTYLNLDGRRFANVAFLSGADSDGDGRSVIGADLDGDGMQDLIVRQAGGGPLLVFKNQFPRQRWLRVSLEGTRSNRLGIGARLTAVVGQRRIVRELYPLNSYRSQQPSEVHFGLASAEKVDRLEIRWPSGGRQVITDVATNQHLRVRETETP